MRDLFPGYYRPEEADFERMWREGLFVPDANVLLNLYRYSDRTRRELLDVLRGLGDGLWLPHRAASEYLSRRLNVIHQQRKKYESFRERLGALGEEIEESARGLHRDSVLEAEDRLEEIRKSLAGLAGYLGEKEGGFAKGSNSPDEDEVWRAVDGIFTGKIGGPLSEERERDVVEKEGPERYDAGVPPGYEDRGKDGERKFGDLLLWFQMLDKAKESQRPIVFVTDDRKDDWWAKSHGRTVGPRRELVAEIGREAGVPFYMYRPPRFMEEARGRRGLEVSDEAIDEAQGLVSIEDEAEEEARETRLAEGYTPVFSVSAGGSAASADSSDASAPPALPPPATVATREALARLNSPEFREAQRFLEGAGAEEVRRRLGSAEAQAAQAAFRRATAPDVQEALRRVNAPDVQEALRRLNSPEVQRAREEFLRRLRGK